MAVFLDRYKKVSYCVEFKLIVSVCSACAYVSHISHANILMYSTSVYASFVYVLAFENLKHYATTAGIANYRSFLHSLEK